MKFTINTKIFQENLKNAISFINKSNKIPTLSNVLIEAKENKITLTATDLVTEGIIEIYDNITITDEGSILTNTDKLLNIIKLSNQETLTLETEDTSLIYSDENSVYELYTLETNSFSKFDMENEVFSNLQIPKSNLEKAINETIFATKTSALRPYFTGINIKTVTNNLIRFTSSDNFRLSISEINLNNDLPFKLDIIVPKKTAQQITKFLENSNNEYIDIHISSKYISLKIDNITINSKLIDDKYPDIEDILTRNYEKTLSIDKETFFYILKKASIFTFDDDRSIIIDIEREKITFYSEDSASGRAKNVLPVKYDYEPLRFSINPQFLFDIENLIKSDIITFKFMDIEAPILIEDKQNNTFKYLVQPSEI